MVETTDATFQEDVLASSLPVLVDFWAPWCGPCRMLTPLVEELAQEMAESLKVVKMNIDENPMTPSQYNIRSVPTLILFDKGATVDMQGGLHSKAALVDWVKELIMAPEAI